MQPMIAEPDAITRQLERRNIYVFPLSSPTGVPFFASDDQTTLQRFLLKHNVP
jgi:hypothetical protein